MRIRSQKDFVAGLVFIAAGLAGTGYAMRRPAGAGPADLAPALGMLLALLGLALAVRALGREADAQAPAGPIAWRPLGVVLGATALFALLLGGVPALGIPSLGLGVAMLGLTLAATFAAPEAWRLSERLLLAGGLALLGGVGCALLLRRPLPMWPAFLAG